MFSDWKFMLGAVLLAALYVWTLTFAILVNTDTVQEDGVETFAYITYPVATIAAVGSGALLTMYSPKQ